MKLLVLYFRDSDQLQTWCLYYGGHPEANSNGRAQLKDGFREMYRVWVSGCFVDGMEESPDPGWNG